MIKKQNPTALKILNCAESIFLEKGYEGASIQDIALKSKTSKSLIYHHFSNKEHLWESVKHMIQSDENAPHLDSESLKAFLSSYVSQHFKAYQHNPASIRLIAWQRVNEKCAKQANHSDLTTHIIKLQEKGEIRETLDPKMINFFIQTNTTALFSENPDFIQKKTKPAQQNKYMEMLIDAMYRFLSPTPTQQKYYVK
ncbi:MAG: TetR/AcrR family transcriptional regulator [Alphaproteobacteria bacterium]|nr:TetR/AcrR family transcriptional regulator [Alphaproteobacteria bacterium]